MDGTIGWCLSGGGARGAYEFGALEVLAPSWTAARIMVGTSAGALGARTRPRTRRRLEAAARAGGEQWLRGRDRRRHRPAVLAARTRPSLLYGLELLGVRAPAPPSLLDTSPQPETIAALIDFEQLARNVEDGTLATAAVVATAYATARSVVFHHGGESPPTDDRRGIDYVATRLAVEHVQASSAIQSLFPAVRVGERWYGDGGVRLNTPLKPALKLNAERLLVIGLNSVAGPPLEYDDRRPDVFDGAAAVAQSLLADQLAHDVDTLSTINDDVKESRTADHTPARAVHLRRADRPARDRAAGDRRLQPPLRGRRGLHHNRELALLGRLLDAGRNPVRGDLLSYLFFAPEFIQPLIELGRRDARAWLDRQGRADPGARAPWPATGQAG